MNHCLTLTQQICNKYISKQHYTCLRLAPPHISAGLLPDHLGAVTESHMYRTKRHVWDSDCDRHKNVLILLNKTNLLGMMGG